MTKVGARPDAREARARDPRGPGWTYEPKWDGFRTIVTVGDEITLDSRGDRPMIRFFPELVSMLEERKDGPFVADGEIVMVRPGSARVRRAPAPAASRPSRASACSPPRSRPV